MRFLEIRIRLQVNEQIKVFNNCQMVLILQNKNEQHPQVCILANSSVQWCNIYTTLQQSIYLMLLQRIDSLRSSITSVNIEKPHSKLSFQFWFSKLCLIACTLANENGMISQLTVLFKYPSLDQNCFSKSCLLSYLYNVSKYIGLFHSCTKVDIDNCLVCNMQIKFSAGREKIIE